VCLAWATIGNITWLEVPPPLRATERERSYSRLAGGNCQARPDGRPRVELTRRLIDPPQPNYQINDDKLESRARRGQAGRRGSLAAYKLARKARRPAGRRLVHLAGPKGGSADGRLLIVPV
jgi:hypothetical protein